MCTAITIIEITTTFLVLLFYRKIKLSNYPITLLRCARPRNVYKQTTTACVPTDKHTTLMGEARKLITTLRMPTANTIIAKPHIISFPTSVILYNSSKTWRCIYEYIFNMNSIFHIEITLG